MIFAQAVQIILVLRSKSVGGREGRACVKRQKNYYASTAQYEQLEII